MENLSLMLANAQRLELSCNALKTKFEGQKIKKIKCTKYQIQYLLESEDCYTYKPAFSSITVIVEQRMTMSLKDVIVVYILNQHHVNKKGKRLNDALYIVYHNDGFVDFFNHCNSTWHDINPETGKTFVESVQDIIAQFINDAS